MLVNLVPEFLAILAAPDPTAAYHEYLDRHKPVLQSYWHNYVLDPTSPHAEQVIAATLRAARADLERLLEDVDVAAIAEEAVERSPRRCEATTTIGTPAAGPPCGSCLRTRGRPSRRRRRWRPGSSRGNTSATPVGSTVASGSSTRSCDARQRRYWTRRAWGCACVSCRGA